MSGPPLRVVTWNVLHAMDLRRGGRTNIDGAAAAIAALDADIVALQEVDRSQPRSAATDQIEELAGRLGYFGAFAPALLGSPDERWTCVSGADPGGPAYGVGLLSRHPITAVDHLRLPGGGDGRRRATASPQRPGWDREPRVALSAVCEIAGIPVSVTTTHLSYLPWRGLRQLATVARVAHGAPSRAVLLGDFNLPPWGVRQVAQGWTHAGGDRTYPADDPRMQVDHVLVRGLRVISAHVGDPAGSDHRPIVAELGLL